jgi:hypothetical protein
MSPKWWTEKAMKFLAFVIQTKEVLEKLQLHCICDHLRKEMYQSNSYRMFAVPLNGWYKLLQNPRKTSTMKAEARTEIFGPPHEWQEQQMTTKAHDDDDVEMPDQDGKMGDQEDEIGDQEDELGGTISFIQVRRLYLRQPLAQLITMAFLAHLYKSGTACYLYEGCPLFDIVAAFKWGEGVYLPLLISVKAHQTISNSEIHDLESRMKKIASSQMQCGKNWTQLQG